MPVEKTNSDLLKYIRESLDSNTFCGPYGLRKVLYLDYVASGRALSFIEDYVREQVLPDYGNTHTTTSVTSLQTTLYRHEARDIIRNATNASEHDAVIFAGSGTTAAIHKLIFSLHLKEPPIIFAGPFEHHSNLLPWREIGAEIISIRETSNGLVDISHLESQLQLWAGKCKQMIGCFTAASNITGILTDVDAVTICLHKYGALAFWDYATAAPYVNIDMNPIIDSHDQCYVYKDAVYFSPHKFIGGISTPGVLIAKKSLFRNPTPEGCGGGTIFFVRREGHRYLQEPEMREEGGTPDIIGSIRAGLVIQLKQAIGTDLILEKDTEMCRIAYDCWKKCKNLVLLGHQTPPSLPIFSFLIYHPITGRFLHHNFVTAILNDVFGIQSRGGCACAGPYAEELLGISEAVAEEYEKVLIEDSRLDRVHLRRYREYSEREILRPGFTRFNLPFFINEECLNFILEALQLVAEYGWLLLPQYMFNKETGEWRHRDLQVYKDRKWLGNISYSSGCMQYKTNVNTCSKETLPQDYQSCLDKAKKLFKKAEKMKYPLPDQELLFSDGTQHLRWFLLPSEAQNCIVGNSPPHLLPESLPFVPKSFTNKESFISQTPSVELYPQETGHTVHNNNTIINNKNSICSSLKGFDTAEKRKEFSESLKNFLEKGFQTSLSDKPLSKVLTFSTNTSATEEFGNTENIAPKSYNCGFDNYLLKSTSQMRRNKIVWDQRLLPGCKEKVAYISPTCSLDSHPQQDTTNDTLTASQPTINDTSHPKSNPLEDISSSKSQSNILVQITKLSTNDDKFDGKDVGIVSSNLMPAVCPFKPKPKKSELKKTKNGSFWFSPPKEIFTPAVKAITNYKMIKDGDHVLICLSGGKDSLSMLHIIHQYKFYAQSKGIHFEIGAVTVDPQTPAYDPSPLKKYLATLNIPYFFESQGILETAANLPYKCDSICSFCSRMKRGRIYACARREKYNVIALGQHLDDLAESFLMSFFHNGILRTMKAHYTVKEGDLHVIRPLVHVREKDLRMFASKCQLPVINENCPACFEAPKERHRMKQLLATQELLFPQIYNSMSSAMAPIMGINKAEVSVHELLANIGIHHEDE